MTLTSRSTNNPNVANAKRVADLYAEVIGVVSQVRFLSVRMKFFTELKNPQKLYIGHHLCDRGPQFCACRDVLFGGTGEMV